MSTARVRRLGVPLLAVGLLLGTIAAPRPVAAAGATITVNDYLDEDSADLNCSLREAVIAANTNAAYHGCTAGIGSDTIVIPPSVPVIALTASLPKVTSTLVIDGGGTLAINVVASGVNGVIENSAGTLTLKGLDISGASTIVVNVGAGATMHLSGMWIHDNSGDSAIFNNGTLSLQASTLSDNDCVGGAGCGIYSNSATLTVADTTISGGHGSTGVAIYIQGGSATVDRSTFSSNVATADAGGIFNNGGTLTVRDSQFLTNTGSQSPAIYNSGGALTVARSGFLGNTSGGQAGAIYLNGGTNTISDARFGSNSGLYAGAVYVAGPTTIRRSTFELNTATGGGGALYLNGTVAITASTFTDNTAPFGGAIYVGNTGATIGSSTFSDNVGTTQGGAIFVTDPLLVANATITRNTSPSGGGIWLNAASSMTLKNSIAAGNAGGDVEGQPLLPASTHNVVGPVANLDTYLQPGGVRFNGGPTDTIRILRVSGSPFIDKGSSSVCSAAPVSSKDQRGVTRPSVCDIGAMELEKTAPVITSSPKPGLRTDVLLSGTSPSGRVTWKATDTGGSGVKRYVVSRSVDGGTWKTLSSSVTSARYNLTVTRGHTYRFRVKAVDFDGNATGWTYGPSFSSRLVQQTAASYVKTWTTSSRTDFSGGSARFAKAAGASASYTFTGRSVALVSTTGPLRGKAKIYVNGVFQATIDLYGMVDVYRAQVWQKTWATSGTRTVKVVVVGTSGRPRVDVDAFAVIR